MCGIAGAAWNRPGSPVDERTLVAMRDSLRHRGPDDSGHWIDEGVALASRRLAILDLSERGHMPMFSEDGRYCIVYNGEVYNYRDIRPLLEGRGYRFRSDTDTEVLLNLFAEEGPAMLDRLNGMFAFAIWDLRERAMFIARDRLGIKPLYYAFRDGSFVFGSEEKALFEAGIPAEFDPACWEELVCFRYVAGEKTPFRGVKRLLPGHYLRWKDGEITVRRWWNLSERARSHRDELPRDPLRWYGETFDDSVRLRRISDVPVGVLLSGGLDSSCVAGALAEQAGSGVASFTVRFADAGYDEGPLAKQVAERWALQYHELTVSDEELFSRVRRATWLHDEPLAHGNDLHILAISEYAKPLVTVLLSGEGADETLGGYVRYQPLRYPALLSGGRAAMPILSRIPKLNNRIRKLRRFLNLGAIDRFVLFNACDVLPNELAPLGMRTSGEYEYREAVLEEAQLLYPSEPARQVMYSDQHTFLCSLLDRNDRMTMGASIECRVPLLDYRLVEGVAALPSSAVFDGPRGKGKRLLRETAGKRTPESVRSGRKWGFATPWWRYLRESSDLRDIVHNLPRTPPFDSGPFEPRRLQATVDAFLSGDDQLHMLVRQIAMIALWHDSCCGDRRPVAQAAAV